MAANLPTFAKNRAARISAAEQLANATLTPPQFHGEPLLCAMAIGIAKALDESVEAVMQEIVFVNGEPCLSHRQVLKLIKEDTD